MKWGITFSAKSSMTRMPLFRSIPGHIIRKMPEAIPSARYFSSSRMQSSGVPMMNLSLARSSKPTRKDSSPGRAFSWPHWE